MSEKKPFDVAIKILNEERAEAIVDSLEEIEKEKEKDDLR